MSMAQSKPLEALTGESLKDAFRSAVPVQRRRRIGLELEKFAMDPESLEPIPYEGPGGIEEAFRRICCGRFWGPIAESERLIGLLHNDGHAITLEPGCQIELSCREDAVMDRAYRAEKTHLAELREAFFPRQVLFCGWGVQPLAWPAGVPQAPKRRYALMETYYRSRNSLASWMMKATCSVQATMDYHHEADAGKKIRVLARITPVLTAMFANSCVSGGSLNGFKSYRSWVWQHTDPDRCGLPECFFEEPFSFDSVIEYALDVPIYYLERRGTAVPACGTTFRRLMKEGFSGVPASYSDWEFHLGCIFTDIRLRKYIEVRCFDRPGGRLAFAAPVLLKGLIYDAEALDELDGWARRYNRREVLASMEEAAKEALSGHLGKHLLLDLARELLAIAREGLGRLQKEQRVSGFEREVFAELEQMILEDGVCPADYVIRDLESGKTIRDIVKKTALRAEG